MTRTDSPSLPLNPARRWREHLLLGGMLVLVIIGMAGLAAATGWAEIRAQLARLGLWQIAILLGLSLVNYLARGLRWDLLARALGITLPLRRNLVHFLAGFALSVTPGRVGELMRLRWISRETGWPVTAAAPLALADRAADLAAIAVLMALGVAFSANGISAALPVAILALLAAWAVTRPGLMASAAGLGYRLTGRAARLFARLRGAARSMRVFSRSNLLLMSGLLGLVGWAAEGLAFWYLLQVLGTDITLARAMLIFTFSTLAGGLTGAPGGVGGAEAAMVALLALDGVPMEVSVPATAVIRLTTLWFAVLIGLAIFPFAERKRA